MGSLFSPKSPPSPAPLAAPATNNINTREAERAGAVRRRQIGDKSSYKNTILGGSQDGSANGYGSGDKTLLSQ